MICGSCSIDRHFNIKGVGTVVIGSIVDGCFKKHDKMKVLPIKKEIVLKSIQKHDVDVNECVKGDHVGLALRGIEPNELDRGYVITTNPSVKMTNIISGRISLVKYWKSPFKEGMMLHIGHWMQVIPCRVGFIDNGSDFRTAKVRLDMDLELIYKPGDTVIIMYLDGGRLRVAGSMCIS